jgi:hypothetical protein
MLEQAVCTIITKSYLAFARALSHTISEHDPNIKLYVLLADDLDGYFNPAEETFKTILLEELPDQDLVRKMCFYYTPFELCCALRGMLHEYMYEKQIARSWIFLDSDILTYTSLKVIFQQLETTSILLNPHILNPLEQQYVDEIEVGILVSGLYNAGFLGLKRSEETQRFIKWFKNRLIHYSFNRRGKGKLNLLFVDQLWLNFVPHFFNDVSFLVHAGANVAYWNLISHSLTKKNNTYFVNDQPLIFIHFTGWDVSQPSKISKHIILTETITLWQELAENYKELLFKYGYRDCQDYPYAFNSFVNEEKITPEMRYIYYEKIFNNEVVPSDPFSDYNYFKSQLYPSHNQPIFQRLRQKTLNLYRRLSSVV